NTAGGWTCTLPGPEVPESGERLSPTSPLRFHGQPTPFVVDVQGAGTYPVSEEDRLYGCTRSGLFPHRLDQIEFGGRTMRALFRACSCAQPKPACLILDSFSKASDLVLGYSMETKKGTPRWRPSNWSERWLLLFNHNGFAVTARILRDTRRGAIRDRHPHLDVMGASSQAGEHCGHWGVDILGRILREE